MKNEITLKMADLEEDDLLALVKKELDGGTDPMELFDACRKGMVSVGDRFDTGEYFVADLMMAGEIFKQVNVILKPVLKGKSGEEKGEIVLGTVNGDVHDIGKDLVVIMLQANGFKVHDMGVDVPPEQFVAKIKETGAGILGLSGLITSAYDGMKNTVKALNDAGLRDTVKVIIGGGMCSSEVQLYTGADAWGKDANAAVTLCNQFTEA